ncbi:MAG TPA: carboxylic ester hydrolase [Clostridium sp.]|nr:carboxylic ester hydrolase [Clostridium sp.]
MRIIEGTYVLIQLIVLFLLIFKEKGATKKNYNLLVISGGLMFTHILIEGARWQMIPAYLITLCCILLVFIKPKEKSVSKKTIFKVFKIASYLLVIAIVVSLPTLFPVIKFPKPTGEYKVGTTSFHLIDKSRKEEYEYNDNPYRELMVQVYYPANSENKQKAPYSDNITSLREALSATQTMPSFITSHLGLIKTHSFKDAEPLNEKEKFPLLLFSHGMSLYNRQNTFQIEEMVSHGYVVVAINYTGDAATSLFPGKEPVPFRPRETDLEFLNSEIKIWEKDASFVLDEVEKGTNDEKLKTIAKMVDFNKIGMLGHSFGGATSTQVLIKDKRIKAAIDMDGGLYGEAIPDKGPEKPYMLINASDSIRNMEEANKAEVGNRDELFAESYKRNQTIKKPGVYTIVLPNTDHGSFTDLAGFSPLISVPGSNYKKTFKLINELSLDFFDKYLKETNTDALDKFKEDHPEIEMNKY